MNVLGIDLSTKPGWAFYQDDKLIRYGTMFADLEPEAFGTYPVSYVMRANHTIHRLFREVIVPCLKASPDLKFVIEETTAPSNGVYTQKILEFLHFALITCLANHSEVHYIRDGSWKSVAGARQNAEERELNKRIKEYKEAHPDEKTAKLDLDGSGKLVVVGKKKSQHYYIRRVRELFGICLSQKEEDAAAAILLAWAFIKGCPLCDGTNSGGLLHPKKKKGKPCK